MPIIKFRDKAMTFNNIYYVDSTKGSDSNTGSYSSPFQTINHAVSKCVTTGDAIFAKAGTHDVTRIAGEYDSGGLWDDNKAISFFGEQGKTIFLCDGTKHKGRDTHCIMFKNAETKAYQITFDFRVGGRTGNYSTSICGGVTAAKGEIINCLFKIDSNYPNFCYSNNGTSITKFTNCIFEVKTNFVGSYSGAGFTIENCATNFSFAGEGTRKNICNTATFDSNYHIVNFDESALNICVYEGIYSWDYTWNINVFLLRDNNRIYSLESKDTWYNTNMTSNNTPAPLVASASSGWSSDYPAWKSFNGTNIVSSYDVWVSANGQLTGWIQIDYGKSLRVNKLRLEATSDAGYLMANPKTFNILYSNDGINFSKATTIRNQTNWTVKENREYVFKEFKARYIRIEVIENNGYSNYVTIGEILFGYKTIALKQIPILSLRNFISYGCYSSNIPPIPTITKDYILQDEVSENEEGLWTTQLDRKPLSISFN